MDQQGMPEHGPDIVLTFRPFIDYLRKRKEESNSHKSRFFSFVVEQFEKYPELLGPVDINRVKDYAELMQLIYSMLSPIVENEEKHRWALSLPLKPVIFYSTNAYFKLVTDIATGNLHKSIATNSEEIRKHRLEFTYSLILEKCYGITSLFGREIVHSLEDEKTGLVKYYKINIDTRFIEIKTANQLPELKIEEFHYGTYDHNELLTFLENRLPLNIFRIEGFGIFEIADVTSEHSIEIIKDLILSRSSMGEDEYYSNVIHSLKMLVGTTDAEFGLLPLLRVNNKLVFDDSTCHSSKLINVAKERGVAESAYMTLASDYFKDPRPLFFREISKEDEARKGYLRMLKDEGVRAYALSPVFIHNAPTGVVEIFSKKKNILNEALLAKLEPVMPLIAQMFKNSIDEFNESIDRVVKEKFTSVQPSVQWKFNEAAWLYKKSEHRQNGHPEIGELVFEKVFPLYGAVDIRNSTVERNAALQKDLIVQFNVLLEVLRQLRHESGFGLIDEKIFVSKKWLEKIKDQSGFSEGIKLNDFMDNDVVPFLHQFRTGNPRYASIINRYFEAIEPVDGVANESRRQLESSMNTIVSSINNYMEKMKDEVQQAYPCFFEKFRTDGVEYDIYIGQSIAPDRPFSDIYLKNLRLLQLTSMAAVARYSSALLPQLPRQVETTQLIFIHSQPIDIRFRKDEKRFDVEGAYNIRYHIVKKRIDKVTVRGTRERVTQPGKIALIYFSQKEADEYIGYIRYLQEQNVLYDDLEELDIEEVQGVAGLKALRVGVRMD